MLILKASALQMRMDRIYIPPLEEEVDSKTTVFEDGGVQNISRIKNLPDTNNCFSTKHRQP